MSNDKRVGSAAIAENLDTGVGMVVDAVDRLGLADNTYVIYMSDNGRGWRRRTGVAVAVSPAVKAPFGRAVFAAR